MIDPGERENGLGRMLHDFIKARVLEKHGKALRIGVVESNRRGHKFWREMGYVESERVERTYGKNIWEEDTYGNHYEFISLLTGVIHPKGISRNDNPHT